MSRKGGYKIINLKGKAITTGEEITINGLYKEIDATDKACLISGAVVDNIEIDDFYMLFEKAGDHYIGITGDNKLTIGEYDTLLWEDYKPSGSAAYTAGDYIQITGDVISANTGDDGLATKEELTNVKAEINRELEGKVDEEDLTKDLTSINTSINSLSTTVGEVQEVATSNHEDIQTKMNNIKYPTDVTWDGVYAWLQYEDLKDDDIIWVASYVSSTTYEKSTLFPVSKISTDAINPTDMGPSEKYNSTVTNMWYRHWMIYCNRTTNKVCVQTSKYLNFLNSYNVESSSSITFTKSPSSQSSFMKRCSFKVDDNYIINLMNKTIAPYITINITEVELQIGNDITDKLTDYSYLFKDLSSYRNIIIAGSFSIYYNLSTYSINTIYLYPYCKDTSGNLYWNGFIGGPNINVCVKYSLDDEGNDKLELLKVN